jgi:hypothetical protein
MFGSALSCSIRCRRTPSWRDSSPTGLHDRARRLGEQEPERTRIRLPQSTVIVIGEQLTGKKWLESDGPTPGGATSNGDG